MPIGTVGALALGAAIPVAAKGVGNIIRGRKTDYDKYNLEKIAELQRKEEMNALGLTPEEEQMLRAQQQGRLTQVQREGEQRRRQLMAASDVGGGAALQQAALADESTAAAEIAGEQAIAEADYRKEQQQRQELEDRMAQEARRVMGKRERRADLVELGAGQVGQFLTSKQAIVGAQSPAAMRAIGQAYGITDPTEQQQFAEYLSANPEMASMFQSSLK